MVEAEGRGMVATKGACRKFGLASPNERLPGLRVKSHNFRWELPLAQMS